MRNCSTRNENHVGSLAVKRDQGCTSSTSRTDLAAAESCAEILVNGKGRYDYNFADGGSWRMDDFAAEGART